MGHSYAAQDINQFVLEAGPAIANSETTVRRIVSTTNARLDVRALCCARLLRRRHDTSFAVAGAGGTRGKLGQRPQHQRWEFVSQVAFCLASASWLLTLGRSFVHGHGGGDVDALLRDAPSMVPSATQAPQ